MTRTRQLTLLAVLLVTPTTAAPAQPRTDAPTGLNPQTEGLGSQQLLDYLGALRTASTTIEVETRGATITGRCSGGNGDGTTRSATRGPSPRRSR